MKILVTGGAGFIGSHIVELLIKEGHSVVVLDSLLNKNILIPEDILNSGNVNFIKGDIRDYGSLVKATERVDIICHQAALISVPESFNKKEEYFSVNTDGTLKILDIANKRKINKVILASSCAIYGNNCFVKQSEDRYTNIQSPYAWTKLMNECYATYYNEFTNVKVTCLRYFNVYGERQSLNSGEGAVIPLFISKITQKQPILVFGDGSQFRDFTNVKDVARANLCAILSQNTGIFNVGTGVSTSINDLIGILEKISGFSIKIDYKNERISDIKMSCADTYLANKQINFTSNICLEEGLQTLLKLNNE